MPTKPKVPDTPAELRRRAELGTLKSKSKNTVPRTEIDSQRLLHELEIHQIELEMQNAELRIARDEAECAREKYTDLYDFAPVGYFTLSPDDRISMANLTTAVMIGIERSRLLGRSFGLQVFPEMRGDFTQILKQVFSDGAERSIDLKLLSNDLPEKVVTLNFKRTPDGSECNVAMVDISARKLAEDILRRSEALFFALIEQVPVGVYVLDAKLRLLQANPMALKFFNNVHPLIGRNFSEIIGLLWTKRNADIAISRFLCTLETGDSFQSTSTTKQRLDNGVREVFEWQIQRVILPSGELALVCFFNNITERINAESAQRRLDVLAGSNLKLKREITHRLTVEEKLHETQYVQSRLLEHALQQQVELRGMSHKILLAQEDERKRISRELHDVIAQTLVGINVHVAALAHQNSANFDDLQQRIANTQKLVEGSLKIVHQFALELRPTVLDDLGLIPALQAFLKDFMDTTGIRVSLEISSSIEEESESIRTTFYRIVQEALMNVAQHAKASSVQVSIRRLADGISLEITTDGHGFEIEEVNCPMTRNRLGLLGMKERAEMVGGVFSVNSEPGSPTTLRVMVGLHPIKQVRNLDINFVKSSPNPLK